MHRTMGSLYACLALAVAGLASCSADRAVTPADSGLDVAMIDAHAETGLVLADGRVDAEEDAIAVEPANSTVTYDLAASPAQPATKRFSARLDGQDVTAASAFELDDPTLGAFSGPMFSSTVPLPLTAIGRTMIVTARASGKVGRTKLTIVRVRATGDAKDFLFYAPRGKEPYPDRDLLSVYASVAGGGAGSDVKVVLRNDEANPPGVDARKLVEIRAMAEGNPKMPTPVCAPQATKDTDGDGVHDTFVAASEERALCFEVSPKPNVTIPSAEGAAFHRVFVDVTTSTGKVLQSRSVVVVVPATDPIPR